MPKKSVPSSQTKAVQSARSRRFTVDETARAAAVTSSLSVLALALVNDSDVESDISSTDESTFADSTFAASDTFTDMSKTQYFNLDDLDTAEEQVFASSRAMLGSLAVPKPAVAAELAALPRKVSGLVEVYDRPRTHYKTETPRTVGSAPRNLARSQASSEKLDTSRVCKLVNVFEEAQDHQLAIERPAPALVAQQQARPVIVPRLNLSKLDLSACSTACTDSHASLPAMPCHDEDEEEELIATSRPASEACGEKFQEQTAGRMSLKYAAVGTAAVGAVGAATGAATGSAVGALFGLLAAPFTFGLSVPIGAMVGSGVGATTGAAVGGVVGATGGGVTGYVHHHYKETNSSR